MNKKYSLKFWFAFWLVATIFLAGWFLYWTTRNSQNIAQTVSGVIDFLPIDSSQKKEYQALARIGNYFFNNDGEERTLLVLFQNNMEIRPGGGFIGAFGIVKINGGKITSLETHDLSNFDARIPDTVEPPYPMKETLNVKSWKLRDSNYSPDFSVNAEKAKEFYYMGQGQEKFDGVVGITTNVLTSILKITGPIQIEGYPGTYDSENAVLSLEYQVEKAFEEQGIERGDRKSVMTDLAKEVEKRVFSFSTSQRIELAKILLEDLNKKDIQMQFDNQELQSIVREANWTGSVDSAWNKDYLMTSDANLGAFKSDYYVKRSLSYDVDLTGEKPKVKLKITYNHTAKQKDWMTRNYLTYLRIYLPQGSEMISSNNFSDARTGEEFGRKYFGAIVTVPIADSKTVEMNYELPANFKNDYALKIQKQAGINDEQVNVRIKNKNGEIEESNLVLNNDLVIE